MSVSAMAETVELPSPEAQPDLQLRDPGLVRAHELFWRDHQRWLEKNGYRLRPRYSPDWVPSWKGKGKGASYWKFEDGNASLWSQALDATRISDGEMVMLKRVSDTINPFEVQISRYFSTEPLASHPRNHCVPVFEVLDVPDIQDTFIIVLPLLRSYNNPRFEAVGEAAEFFRQIFEGLLFMHQCHVAHRDCMTLNVMMDPRPMFPGMFHPVDTLSKRNFKGTAKHYSRTARPTKYFFIDFGLSRKFKPEDGPPRAVPILGGDKTVPEFQYSIDPCDPFPTDVYYLGNMIREDFLNRMHGIEFIEPLISDMVQDDPSKRPTMEDVVERFAHILRSLSSWTLRSRLIYNNEDGSEKFVRNLRHFFRTAVYIMMLRPAIPTP